MNIRWSWTAVLVAAFGVGCESDTMNSAGQVPIMVERGSTVPMSRFDPETLARESFSVNNPSLVLPTAEATALAGAQGRVAVITPDHPAWGRNDWHVGALRIPDVPSHQIVVIEGWERQYDSNGRPRNIGRTTTYTRTERVRVQ